MPFQYLVNAQHWQDHVLAVGPGVLIPRPETHGLVELAVAHMDQSQADEPSHGLPSARAHMPWVDLGCGSGVNSLAAGPSLMQ